MVTCQHLAKHGTCLIVHIMGIRSIPPPPPPWAGAYSTRSCIFQKSIGNKPIGNNPSMASIIFGTPIYLAWRFRSLNSCTTSLSCTNSPLGRKCCGIVYQERGRKKVVILLLLLLYIHNSKFRYLLFCVYIAIRSSRKSCFVNGSVKCRNSKFMYDFQFFLFRLIQYFKKLSSLFVLDYVRTKYFTMEDLKI